MGEVRIDRLGERVVELWGVILNETRSVVWPVSGGTGGRGSVCVNLCKLLFRLWFGQIWNFGIWAADQEFASWGVREGGSVGGWKMAVQGARGGVGMGCPSFLSASFLLSLSRPPLHAFSCSSCRSAHSLSQGHRGRNRTDRGTTSALHTHTTPGTTTARGLEQHYTDSNQGPEDNRKKTNSHKGRRLACEFTMFHNDFVCVRVWKKERERVCLREPLWLREINQVRECITSQRKTCLLPSAPGGGGHVTATPLLSTQPPRLQLDPYKSWGGKALCVREGEGEGEEGTETMCKRVVVFVNGNVLQNSCTDPTIISQLCNVTIAKSTNISCDLDSWKSLPDMVSLDETLNTGFVCWKDLF